MDDVVVDQKAQVATDKYLRNYKQHVFQWCVYYFKFIIKLNVKIQRKFLGQIVIFELDIIRKLISIEYQNKTYRGLAYCFSRQLFKMSPKS